MYPSVKRPSRRIKQCLRPQTRRPALRPQLRLPTTPPADSSSRSAALSAHLPILLPPGKPSLWSAAATLSVPLHLIVPGSHYHRNQAPQRPHTITCESHASRVRRRRASPAARGAGQGGAPPAPRHRWATARPRPPRQLPSALRPQNMVPMLTELLMKLACCSPPPKISSRPRCLEDYRLVNPSALRLTIAIDHATAPRTPPDTPPHLLAPAANAPALQTGAALPAPNPAAPAPRKGGAPRTARQAAEWRAPRRPGLCPPPRPPLPALAHSATARGGRCRQTAPLPPRAAPPLHVGAAGRVAVGR